MASDRILELNDQLETEPAELGPAYVAACKLQLAKGLAARYNKPWTPELETDLQEKFSALVAAAKNLGLTEFNVVAVKPDGRRVKRTLSVEKVSRTRALQ